MVEDYDTRQAFSLVSKFPANAKPSTFPITLFNLLEREREDPQSIRPSLEERIHLARQLASSFYTFTVVQ